MAADEDRKGTAGAKKAPKGATATPAKPAVSAVRGGGRSRKVASPQLPVEEPRASASAATTPTLTPVAAPAPVAAPIAEPAPTPLASETANDDVAPAPAVEAAPSAEPVAEATPVAEPEPVVAVEEALPEPVPDIAQDGPEAEVEGMTTAAEVSDKTPQAANAFAGLFTPFMIEDKMMDINPNFSGFQDAMTEAQAKAKAAFEKSTSMLGEVSDFTKGNVEALVESGKIFADGMQGIGSELVTEGRSAFETMTGDIKELAGAKSPTDFFKIQGEMMRKNFDSAIAYGSKNSEAMLKLMSDAIAPISGRVSIAMEKARSASV